MMAATVHTRRCIGASGRLTSHRRCEPGTTATTNMQKGLVSVICVNWNGEKYIRRTMDSLLEQTYAPVEIIVVDNNSADNSAKILKDHYPRVVLLAQERNLGWPAGLNAGIRACHGEYIAPLNNDLWMDRRCVEEMVGAINGAARYGSCAAKIYLDKDRKRIEAAGVGIYADGLSYARGRLQPSDGFEQEEEVFCASDCCCLYKREMLNDIGLYDERFFLYAEETEMGWRHQLAGWKCIYTPKAIAYHEHSASSGGFSVMKAFHVERNRIWVALRYFPATMLIFKVPVLAFYRYFRQVMLSVTGKGGTLAQFREQHSWLSCLSILMKAHWSAFLSFPHYIKLRGASPIRISRKEIRAIFKKYGCSAREAASYE